VNQETVNEVVIFTSLGVGTLLVGYGLAEGYLDHQEHRQRLKAVRQTVNGERPSTTGRPPGEDIGEEQSSTFPSAEDLAKVAESLKGLPRCVQVFFVAALFFIFALVAASVGTVVN
jgi:hypothetical protein